jgi:hypothetical protein
VKLRTALLTAAITIVVSGCVTTDNSMDPQASAAHDKEIADFRKADSGFLQQCVQDGYTRTDCLIKLNALETSY